MQATGRVWVLLIVLLAIALTAAGAASVAEPPGARGTEHPEFTGMHRGGDGAARHGALLGAGLALGALIFAAVAALMSLGYRPETRLGRAFAAAALVQVALFSAVVLAYRAGLADPGAGLLGPFPAATAWLVFGLWPSGLLFAVIVVGTFDRAFWRPADEARFRALVDDRA